MDSVISWMLRTSMLLEELAIEMGQYKLLTKTKPV